MTSSLLSLWRHKTPIKPAQKQKGRIGMRPLYWDETQMAASQPPVFLPVVLVVVVMVVATAFAVGRAARSNIAHI
ncbi:MAG: hypothetical protein IPK59_14475 [Rhodospirillaceae bacterium]|nr:hypothetical protein [Rhodospirillaceae bacterium]